MRKQINEETNEETQDALAESLADVSADEPGDATLADEAKPKGRKARAAAQKEAQAEADKVDVPKDVVRFVSTVDEIGPYDILVAGESIRGSFNAATKRVTFHVPKDKVERFRLHHHVQTERLEER